MRPPRNKGPRRHQMNETRTGPRRQAGFRTSHTGAAASAITARRLAGVRRRLLVGQQSSVYLRVGIRLGTRLIGGTGGRHRGRGTAGEQESQEDGADHVNSGWRSAERLYAGRHRPVRHPRACYGLGGVRSDGGVRSSGAQENVTQAAGVSPGRLLPSCPAACAGWKQAPL
jgi:hypothetical protein